MKLTIILGNMYGVRLDAMYTGTSPAPTKRTVTIELTEEQVKQINIREVGKDLGKPKYEEIFDCFIETEIETNKAPEKENTERTLDDMNF